MKMSNSLKFYYALGTNLYLKLPDMVTKQQYSDKSYARCILYMSIIKIYCYMSNKKKKKNMNNIST